MVDPVSTASVAAVAIAALQSPAVAKLTETVSAGLGRALEPLHRKRLAAAEAANLVTMATAQVEARAIERRAAERILLIEVRRQENIEAIIDDASKSLPGEVNDVPVSPDWTARFFDACQDVSDEEMRSLWGKVLAGEVTEPGSYSLRTLHALQHLSKAEAASFESLCSGSLVRADLLCPLIFDFTPAAMLAAGFLDSGTFIQPLSDAGLIRVGAMVAYAPPDSPTGLPFLAGQHGTIWVKPLSFPENPKFRTFAMPNQVTLGQVTLTTAGAELARLTAWAPSQARMNAAIDGWRRNGHEVVVEN